MKRFLAALLLALVLVAAGAAAYGYSYYRSAVDQSASGDPTPVHFRITPGETTAEIAGALRAAGLIRSTLAFRIYVRLNGAGSGFQAGDFTLARTMTLVQIVDALQHSVPNQLRVTIPEGLTAKQEAADVEKAGIGTAAQYLAAEAGPGWSLDFLASRPPGADLEGYLFPDTYSLDDNATAKDLIQRQLERFGQIFTAEWRTAIQSATAARPAMSIEQIVILASITQGESSRASVMAPICSVFYNRLAASVPLQSDVTVYYATGKPRSQPLTTDDTRNDSPYNTYVHAGLPPGPVDSPGQAALAACVSPPKTGYMYFFADTQGTVHFYSQAQYDAGQFCSDQRKYGVSGSGTPSC